MSIVQWLLLVLVVVIVAGAYWYIRRQGSGDPWQGMDEPGESDGKVGDSYVVKVRTINKETPADRKASVQAARAGDAGQGANGAPADRDRAKHQPTAVRRKSAVAADPETTQGTTVRSSEVETPPELDSIAESDGAATPTHADPQDRQTAPAATERLEMVAPEPSEQSQVFMLYITAADGRVFNGPAIHGALARANLKFGLNDMYHRVTEVHGVTESVFCVANMLNPGTLDPVDQDQLSTPGLALFLLVPGPLEGRAAMRDMMEAANRVATELEGHVLDDNRARLKMQTAQFMLDQVADIDRRAQLARRR